MVAEPRWSTGRRFASLITVGLSLACSPVADTDGTLGSPPTSATGAGEIGIAIDPPAGPLSFAPDLNVSGGELLLTWLEADETGEASARHRLNFSRFGPIGWAEPKTIAEGNDFFANWADFPAVVKAGNGSLLAHWLAKTGKETYAYSIFLARSTDGGASWSHLGRLNDDDTASEHGFVSWVSEGLGARAFWLDGREMPDGGSMSLRTALIEDAIGRSEVLDRRTCECCSTDAAAGAAGPMVVFRDRSVGEIRDVALIRSRGDDWTGAAIVAADGWEIPGCPVNGPEIAAHGESVAVAWFTAAGDAPRVQMAFSADSGASFSDALLVDAESPHGRVDVVLDDQGGAVVSWLARGSGAAEVCLRRTSADGRIGEVVAVGETGAKRASGFPRLARLDDQLFVAWVDTLGDGDSRHVRVRRIPLTEVPPIPAG